MTDQANTATALQQAGDDPAATESLVFVRWIDHAACAKWHPQAQIAEELSPCQVESVGWVVREEVDYLILVSSRCPQDETAARGLLIMKPMIRKRLPLNVQSRRGRR